MKTRLVMVIGAAAILMLPVSWAHAGETAYRWRDAKGGVHYGSNPPIGVKAELIRVRSGTTERGEEAAELSPAEKQQLEYCDTARKNLEMLSGTGDVMRRDEYGQEQKLTPEEKAAERARAEEAVRKQCPAGS